MSQKWARSEYIFSLYDEDIYPIHKQMKVNQKYPCFTFKSFHSILVWPWIVMIIWDFQSVYGSQMIHLGEGVASQNEPVHLDEPVRTHVIRSFIFRGIHYFTEPSEGKFLIFGKVRKVTNFTHVNGHWMCSRTKSSFYAMLQPIRLQKTVIYENSFAK